VRSWSGTGPFVWPAFPSGANRVGLAAKASAYPGEELRFVGRVVGKREQDGQCLIDLEIHEEKGDREVLMPGSATVSLPRSS